MKNKHITDDEIIFYLENEISIKDRIRVDEHIKKCSACKNRLKEYELIEKKLRRPVLYDPPVDLLNNIMNRVWKKKLSFEEIFIGLLITFSGIITVIGFIIYNYGFKFFYNLPFMKISFSSLIKTGINNLNELIYVLTKIYNMINTLFLSRVTIPKHWAVVLLVLVLIFVSYIKKDIIIKGKK